MSFLSGFKQNAGVLGGSIKQGAMTTFDRNKDGKLGWGEKGLAALRFIAAPQYTAARVGYNAYQARNPQQTQQAPLGSNPLYSWGQNSFSDSQMNAGNSSWYNAPQYGQSSNLQPTGYELPNTANNAWYQGPGAGSMPQSQPQAPQSNFLSGPRITPQQMPVRNGLDFMDTQGSAYQSRNAPLYPQSNNGYFDMNKANTVNGNWVNGAGWRTDANKAFGQTQEDMAFNASMAQRLGSMSQ